MTRMLGWWLLGLGGLALFLLARPATPVWAITPTPGPMIEVMPGTEPQIAVRAGPSVEYPVVGMLVVGQRAPALGRSPGGNWIQIRYPAAPDGVGWVFFRYVRVLNGPLPVVEPPPTPTEPIPTPDPTLQAQFLLPTPPTRLPTFTPPPPLVPPTFLPPEPPLESRFPVAIVLAALFLFGGLGLVVSYLQER